MLMLMLLQHYIKLIDVTQLQIEVLYGFNSGFRRNLKNT